jgi:hypothetical protein
MIFGITLYGLAAVAVLLALYCVAVLRHREATWALAVFVGSAVAFVLPAHIAVALLAVVGVGSAWAIRIGRSLWARQGMPDVLPIWRRTFIVTGALLLATVAWASLTSQVTGGTGGSTDGTANARPVIDTFNASWRVSVAITALGAGVFYAIAVAWVIVRKTRPGLVELFVATMAILVVGAIGWGARMSDFTMFYLFYAGIAVIATPVAAVAIWTIWERLRATQHKRLAAALIVLCAVQLEFGVVAGILRLQFFGARDYPPIPETVLEAIEHLPEGSKLAYTCEPLEEVGFATPRLLGIDAHTGRRVIPMCFEAELLSALIGGEPSEQIENLFFSGAPQRALYPNAAADPPPDAVRAFLKDHGIGYIYADAMHPNTLVVDAVPIASSGDAQVLMIP